MIETVFTVKQVNVDSALKQAEKKAQQTAKKIDKSLQEAGKDAGKGAGKGVKEAGKAVKDSLQQAGKGMESINKLGGTLGGVFKNATEALSGMLSPIGLITAGLTALVAAGVKMWDRLTESAQQYKARMQSMANILKSENEQIDKNKKQSDELLDILAKLQNQEALSNAQKLLSIKILEQLTAKYGDLGIEIDTVTGKIKNFDDVQRKLAKRQKDKKNQKLFEITLNAKQQAHRQASQMTKEMGHDWSITGTQVFRYDTNKYKSVKEAQKKGFDVKFNPTHDLTYIPGRRGTPGVWHKTEISDTQKRLRQLWNEGGIQGKMQFAKGMQQLYKGDEEKRKIFEELYKKLKEYREADKNLNTFERYGTTDANEIIRKINEEAKVQEKQDTQTKTKVDSMKQQQELKKEQAQFKSLDTDAQRIQFYQKKLNKEKEKGLELEKKSDEVLEKRNNKVEQYNELAKKLNSKKLSNEQNLEVSQKALILLKQLNSLNAQKNDINIQLTENTGKQLQLELAIKELKQKSSEYYKSSLDALNAEIQITKLKLNGLNEEAEKQKFINELKNKGLVVDENEIDLILKKKKELAELKKEQELFQKEQKFYDDKKQALNREIEIQKLLNAGKTEEVQRQKLINELKNQGLTADQTEIDLIMKKRKELAGLKMKEVFKTQAERLLAAVGAKVNGKTIDFNKKVQQYEKQYGVKLDNTQRDAVRALIDVETQIESMSRDKLNFSGMEIRTNALTARGGLSGGAVAPDKNAINAQIRDYQRNQISILNDIKNKLRNVGII